MEKEINAGIIGLGKMGILHTGILNSLDSVNVTAIADKESIIKKIFGNVLPSVRKYDSYKKMLDEEELDIVFITTPTALHVEMAEECLDRGINFFVEKPLGVSGEECKTLIFKTEEKSVTNMVGYCKHFVDTFSKAKELIDGGNLGKPVYLTSYMYVSQQFSKGSGWRYKKEASGGGVLSILATHLVDVLLWFFGDVISVNGQIKPYYSKEVEDFVHSYLIFKNGLEGYIDASWSVRNYRLPQINIEVQFENGMLVVTEDYVKYFSDINSKFNILYKQDLYKGVDIDIGGAEYTREDKYFVNCVRNHMSTELDIFYAYKVQCVIDAIYESANKKELVEIV
ncbi:MAG: Gfo/Idh/MocA family oxidoreductase [Methanocellales archaeon]|nr:Gfo/Idh/MocA family oxidoreductase [Methanocellales archaeon]MDD3420921.1 Gfo/Idh/MocA family oxidoreductase [Methanocellales archaeon]MDD4897783.1 Gfo/Idh/MocA family oxidoreductase [Methanocellales archaeon]MDD5446581.1 Gfo/Idh/MocA family oxidoreductase [Methanocellales archaeon]